MLKRSQKNNYRITNIHGKTHLRLLNAFKIKFKKKIKIKRKHESTKYIYMAYIYKNVTCCTVCFCFSEE